MRLKTFISLMFLLLLLTTGILVATTVRRPMLQQEHSGDAGGTDNTQVQATDGSMIWESVSRHLLSAVQ